MKSSRQDLETYSRQVEDALGVPPLVRSRGKGPFDHGWSTGPREQPTKWRDLLRDWIGNVGVITGNGLVVVDVDLYVTEAEDSWQALRDQGFTSNTVTCITGGGGRHYYYRVPDGVRVLSHALEGYPGIDIKADGGFVVCPPSTHPDAGTLYEWEYTWTPFDLAPVVLDEPQCQVLGLGSPTHNGLRALDVRDDASLAILLEFFNAHHVTRRGQTIQVTRPGKERGCSAEVGYLGPGVVKVWSSNWEGLPAGTYEPRHLRKLAGIPEIDWRARIKPAVEEGTPTLREFLNMAAPEFDWLVPNLLERGDRLVLTGPEGYGKSTLLRQLGLGAAAGVNTLTTSVMRKHDPLRVLLVDLENSSHQLRRQFTKQLAPLPEDGTQDRLCVEVRPDGLILNNPREGDRDWLVSVIEETTPDVLILGPIYKMIDGDPSDEAPNRDLVKWLDVVRTKYGLAILLEAHTPHDVVRPYGWSGWKRWPEFGLHIHRDGRLEPWRQGREERAWPTALRKGTGNEWLWMPTDVPTAPVDRDEDRIADAGVAVLRCLHAVGRPMSANEVVLWLGKNRNVVLAAIARLRGTGMVTTTPGTVTRANGRPMPVDFLTINPEHAP